jgi:2-iminobutanoate/2-iminopropanoate deaminase
VTGREHMQAYMRARDRKFPGTPPASTLMIVSGFARPEFVVEIEAIAAAPE